jgi:hypothetical protein
MSRSIAVILLLLAGYAALLSWLGGLMALIMVAVPHIPVMLGKVRDPLGGLMFAIYAAAESVLLGFIVFLIACLFTSTQSAMVLFMIAILFGTLREVYRYLTIDHFPSTLAKVFIFLACLIYFSMFLG